MSAEKLYAYMNMDKFNKACDILWKLMATVAILLLFRHVGLSIPLLFIPED